MSVLPFDNPEFVHDLTRRKEFYSLKGDPDYNFKDPGIADEFAGKHLKLQAHQLFARNFFNPNTPPGRFQLSHLPGMGKTLAACAVGAEFIRVYKRIYANLAAKMPPGYRSQIEVAKLTPSIIVLGFGGTKAAFMRELLGNPEFGFISVAEKEELARRRLASLGGFERDVKNYKEYQVYLKKRITNKSKDGFYRFYGYDEFVNKLFIGQGTSLTEIEADTAAKIRAGENITLEQEVTRLINDGKIRVDQQFLNSLEGCLFICDEVHNTYNMHMKNNRGVALQYIIDTLKTIWVLTMTATLINNSPTEVVEPINYLSDIKVTKQELFITPRKLAPGALDKIAKLLRGKVSFIQDSDPKYFPERVFMGEDVKIPHRYEDFPAGSIIPYLKFIPCEMSAFHQHTLENYLKTRADDMVPATSAAEFSLGDEVPDVEETAGVELNEPETSHTIATDSYCIYDAVFPNPESDEFGIFKSTEIRTKLATASQEWKDANMIGLKKYSSAVTIPAGEFMAAAKIGKFWPKAAKLVTTLHKLVGSGEKCMVYHDRVRTPGVVAIQEVLRTNGFLDENTEPVDDTLCVHCGHRMKTHTGAESDHKFAPARYITVHSEMDKQSMVASLAKFNAPENSTGANYMIIIGSRIIKESYDFKDVQHLFIMSLPTNISTLIQVLGRCIRRGSHFGLPPENRRVSIYILLTTAAAGAEDPISPEMYRYMDKILDYMVIQDIERAINSGALDGGLFRDIIMPPALRAKYFPDGATDPVAGLGNLYFEPSDGIPEYRAEELNLATFLAHKHFDDEVKTIRYLIKRLFMKQPVFTYDDLFAAVRRPPIGIEVNPTFFDERNFITALSGLVSGTIPILSNTKRVEMSEAALVERLMDTNDKYIYISGNRYAIAVVGKYYIAAPVTDPIGNPLNVVHTEYVDNIRDKERAMINDLVVPNQTPSVDVESYLRPQRDEARGIKTNLASFIKESKDASNYMVKRREFLDNYKKRNFLLEYSAQFQMSFVEESIEHTLAGTATEPHSHIISLLVEFGAIIRADEVAKYRDVVKHFTAGAPSGTGPVGYLRAKSARIYDAVDSRWFEIGRVSLNRHITFKENDIIIGYLETSSDNMKFKIRKPVQKLRADLAANAASKTETGAASVKVGVGDIRIVERGSVCSTKSKRDLLKIAGSIGISVRANEGEKVFNLCKMIFERLVELEKKERDRDSMYKYLYSWWDEPVNIVGGLRV